MKIPLPSGRSSWHDAPPYRSQNGLRPGLRGKRCKLAPPLLLAACFVLCLVGCGSGGGENTNPAPSPSATGTPTPVPSATPVPGEASPLPSPTPSAAEPTPSPTPTATPEPTPTSTPTPTPVPTSTPTPTPSPTPTPIVVAVSPTVVTVSPLGTRQFAAYIGNTSDLGITWFIQEGASGGSITSDGLYTAPLGVGTYHLLVTSHADPSKTATATISVNDQVSISPAAPTVTLSDTISFSASVPGASTKTFSWRVLESGGGTISSSGVYTAPRTSGAFHIIATSGDDPSKSGVVTVTVKAGSAKGGVQ